MLTTKITVERHDAATNTDNEIELTITGEYYPGSEGHKAHPMDRFAPPDDPAEVDILSVKDESGFEVELSDEEVHMAEEALERAAVIELRISAIACVLDWIVELALLRELSRLTMGARALSKRPLTV